MKDRELLELAAKAAGVDGTWHEVYGTEVGQDACGISAVAAPRWSDNLWNPLTDDGDALRLAVRLRLHVRVCRHSVLVEMRELGDDIHIRLGTDPYSATRRAIVRAAASIGGTRHG